MFFSDRFGLFVFLVARLHNRAYSLPFDYYEVVLHEGVEQVIGGIEAKTPPVKRKSGMGANASRV